MKRRTAWVMMGLAVWASVELVSPAAACVGDWPGWRGPTGCGTTDEKDFVLKWDGKTGEGIASKAPLKGAAGLSSGHSSPIVWGDRVFVTTTVMQTLEQEEAKEIPDHHFAGSSYVIKAGPKSELLGGSHAGGWDIGASPAASGGRIFVRDADFLYCVGRK